MKKQKKGKLEVICGPMKCGKTQELIRRLDRAKIGKKHFLVFKPAIDVSSGEEIKSRSKILAYLNLNMSAISVADEHEMMKYLETPNLKVIAIDEAQFFNRWLLNVVDKFIDRGVKVIVSGLDMDFSGRPFGVLPDLMTKADEVLKLKSVCDRCGSDEAIFSQRLINGKPATKDSPLIVIKDQEASITYEARCRDCHEID